MRDGLRLSPPMVMMINGDWFRYSEDDLPARIEDFAIRPRRKVLPPC